MNRNDENAVSPERAGQAELEEALGGLREEVVEQARDLGFSRAQLYLRDFSGRVSLVLRARSGPITYRFFNLVASPLDSTNVSAWRAQALAAFSRKLQRAALSAGLPDGLRLYWVGDPSGNGGHFVVARSRGSANAWVQASARARGWLTRPDWPAEPIADLPAELDKVDDETFEEVDERQDVGLATTAVLAAVGGIVLSAEKPRQVMIVERTFTEARVESCREDARAQADAAAAG